MRETKACISWLPVVHETRHRIARGKQSGVYEAKESAERFSFRFQSTHFALELESYTKRRLGNNAESVYGPQLLSFRYVPDNSAK